MHDAVHRCPANTTVGRKWRHALIKPVFMLLCCCLAACSAPRSESDPFAALPNTCGCGSGAKIQSTDRLHPATSRRRPVSAADDASPSSSSAANPPCARDDCPRNRAGRGTRRRGMLHEALTGHVRGNDTPFVAGTIRGVATVVLVQNRGAVI